MVVIWIVIIYHGNWCSEMFLRLWLSSVLVKRFEVFIKQLIISGKRSTEIIWISVNLQHRDLENV